MITPLSKITALEAAVEYLIKATAEEEQRDYDPEGFHEGPRHGHYFRPGEREVGGEEVEVVQAPEAKPEDQFAAPPRKKAHLELNTVQGDVRPALAIIFHKGFKVSDFQDMYSIGLEDFSTIIEDIGTYDAAFVSELSDIEGAVTSKKGVKIRVDIQGNLGQSAGSMLRSFKRVNGELRVTHHSFMVNRLYQGKGIAADINENVEEEYEKLGVYSITLRANADVGGYAWARQGYDFATDSDREQIRWEFQSNIKRMHTEGTLVSGGIENQLESQTLAKLLEEVDSFKHAWEFAEWHLNGEHLGKELMLGSNWEAKKILDKESKGYQLGKEYFAAKRNKKNIS